MHGVATHVWRADVAIPFQSWQELWTLLQSGVSYRSSNDHTYPCKHADREFRRALSFEGVLFIFMFFPVAPNPDIPNFNWTTLVFGVTVLWAVGYYHVWGKKKYAGPVAHVKRQGF